MLLSKRLNKRVQGLGGSGFWVVMNPKPSLLRLVLVPLQVIRGRGLRAQETTTLKHQDGELLCYVYKGPILHYKYYSFFDLKGACCLRPSCQMEMGEQGIVGSIATKGQVFVGNSSPF